MRMFLFYDGYDLKAIDRPCGKYLSHSHKYARAFKRKLLQQQVKTGYYTAFQELVTGLKYFGHEVAVNNFKLARLYPNHPIGLCGFKSVINKTKNLTNPCLFGPGQIPSPEDMKIIGEQINKILLRSQWEYDLCKPYIKNDMSIFFTAIDTKKWKDLSHFPKQFDFLIYDKMYFEDKNKRNEILSRITNHLDTKEKNYHILKYGKHTQAQYKNALHKCKNLIWLCAHETQGMAYQEALASNLPVLAWDEGLLKDNRVKSYAPENITVSSVPYFDERCGERFKLNNFENICDLFLQKQLDYRPREYVRESLSTEKSLNTYLQAYKSLIKNT